MVPLSMKGVVPFLGQGGADSSRWLLSGWFEAAEGSETQLSCFYSQPPPLGRSAQHPLLSRGGEPVSFSVLVLYFL